MRILALNVQHCGPKRATAVADAVLAREPDIALLSEVGQGAGTEQLLERLAAGGLTSIATGIADPHVALYTVAAASRTPFESVRVPLAPPHEHAVLELELEGLTIVAVYFPLGEAHLRCWDDAFTSYAHTVAPRQALIAGDWNTASSTLDIAGAAVPGMDRLEALLGAGWTDAWRTQHPEAREYTWHHRASGNGFRLDHALLSSSLRPALRSATHCHEMRTVTVSDHAGLLVELDLSAQRSTAEPSAADG